MVQNDLVHSIDFKSFKDFKLSGIEFSGVGSQNEVIGVSGSVDNAVYHAPGLNQFKISIEIGSNSNLRQIQRALSWFEAVEQGTSHVATNEETPKPLKSIAKVKLQLDHQWTKELQFHGVFPCAWEVASIEKDQPIMINLTFSYDEQKMEVK